MSSELLSIGDLRSEYGLGRDLATRLVRLLPHVQVGRRGRGAYLLVRRADFDFLVNRATVERVDLWHLARKHTPESLQLWLQGQPHLRLN